MSACAPRLLELYGWYEGVEPMLDKLYRDISVVPAVAHQMEHGAIPYLNYVTDVLAAGRRATQGDARRDRPRARLRHLAVAGARPGPVEQAGGRVGYAPRGLRRSPPAAVISTRKRREATNRPTAVQINSDQ